MDEIAKLPPHNLEAETSLLASMMLSREAIEKATENVSSDDFYKAAHREIFSAILQLDQTGTPVDNVTLCEALRQRDQLTQVGGAAYLAQMLNSVPTAANAEYYAKIV
ncbi:MAG TPA: DnaB-like helicase N-terminal domain-containing protein, partial [Candidatus Ozemobacteraceae bacterium]|nr:DnaB-like helicase N-terminal domain-containing protein [Candidatus Ozemobacteraceae bacterium]